MNNPYRMLENWGTLPEGVMWGATIGIIPDGKAYASAPSCSDSRQAPAHGASESLP